jgi:hypothetical protein
MSVITEAIGVPVRNMLPFLEKFRKTGEGIVGTLLRLNAETTYVEKGISAIGGKLQLLPKIASTATSAQISAANAAQEALTAVTTKYNSIKNDTTAGDGEGYDGGQARLLVAETELAAARRIAVEASDAVTNAETTNIQANIALTQKLIDNAGGIDKFTEQLDFFQTNFVNSMQTFGFNYGQLSDKLSDLGVSTTLSREGFTALVQAQDLNTEAGQALYQELMNVAPAFDALQSTIEGWAGEMSSAFLASIENGDSAAQTGEYVAQTIAYSIQKTIYDQGVTAIMNTISSGIIAPIIAGAIAGKSATEIIGALQIEAIKAQVKTIAATLKILFNSEGFTQLMNEVTAAVSGMVSTAATILPALPKKPELTKVKDASNDATDAADALAKKLKELADAAKSSVTSLFDKLISTLKKNADGIKSTINKLKDFIKSISEFKTSLLLGNKSTMTPAEKYALAKSQFTSTYEKALSGDEAAINKLQSVSESFLEASSSFYASGSQYTEDFNSVLSAIDTSISTAQSFEERLNAELSTINDQLFILGGIDTTLTNIYDVLSVGLGDTSANLLEYMKTAGFETLDESTLLSSGLVQNANQAKLLIQALGGLDKIISKDELIQSRNIGSNTNSLQTAINNTSSATIAQASTDGINTIRAGTIGTVGSSQAYYSSGGAVGYANDTSNGGQVLLKTGQRISALDLQNLIKTQGAELLQSGQHEALYNILTSNGIGSDAVSALTGIPQSAIIDWAVSKGLPAFDTGINFVPEDMVAQIHKGERIFPAADNEELMKSVKGNNNQELIQEIRRLNDKVEKLETAIARGAIINAQATDRNTEAVVDAVKTTGDRGILANRVRDKAQIV